MTKITYIIVARMPKPYNAIKIIFLKWSIIIYGSLGINFFFLSLTRLNWDKITFYLFKHLYWVSIATNLILWWEIDKLDKW